MKVCFAVQKDEGINSTVYISMAPTVKDNLDLLKDGKLPELTMQHACSGHQGGQGGCGHGH